MPITTIMRDPERTCIAHSMLDGRTRMTKGLLQHRNMACLALYIFRRQLQSEMAAHHQTTSASWSLCVKRADYRSWGSSILPLLRSR